MNCLFNSTVDLSIFGGARTHTVEKITAFYRLNDVTVTLICYKKDSTLTLPFKCFAPTFSLPYSIPFQLLFELWSCFICFIVKKKNSSNILFLRYRPLAFLTFVFYKSFGWKIVFEPNDNIVQQLQQYKKYRGFYKLIVDFCLNYCFKKSDIIICHSMKIKSWVESYGLQGKGRAIISSMGANPNLFVGDNSAGAKQKLGYSPSDIIFIDTGTFTPWGGEDALISAMGKLRETNKLTGNYLFLTGRGDLQKQYQEQVAQLGLGNNVIFKNGVPYEKVADYINAADLCFCLKKPQLDVTSPNRLFEYLFCAKPVVLTDVYQPYFSMFSSIQYADPKNNNFIVYLMEHFKTIFDYNAIMEDCKTAKREFSWDAIAHKLLHELRI
jgi:glycosyltransferase involved in cell wall biosynthesis